MVNEKNPVKRQRQVDDALNSILGRRAKPGMRTKQDGELLLELARRWHKKVWSEWRYNRDAVPALRPLVVELLSKFEPDHAIFKHVERDSLVRRLEGKFKKHQRLLLSKICAEDDWHQYEPLRRIARIIREIESLGIRMRPLSVRDAIPIQ